MGSISARVINIWNNQPLSGVEVKVSGNSTGEAKTGEDGVFKISNLNAANDYKMNVSLSGFKPENYSDLVVIDDIDTNLGYLALSPED